MEYNAEAILKSLPAFVGDILNDLKEFGVDVSRFQLDHACYRVETEAEYLSMRNSFSKLGKKISEAQIGGRPISTFLLNHAVSSSGRSINCVELPAPKSGAPYKSGWEHCEFVIQESFEEFTKRYPRLEWDFRASSKSRNPDVSLKLRNGRSVKFHHQTLENVIAEEEANF